MKDILYPLRVLHGKLYEHKLFNEQRKEYKKIFRDNPNTVFLLLTPEHGNIGDHAIAFSETSFISHLGLKYIEITGRKLDDYRKSPEGHPLRSVCHKEGMEAPAVPAYTKRLRAWFHLNQ